MYIKKLKFQFRMMMISNICSLLRCLLIHFLTLPLVLVLAQLLIFETQKVIAVRLKTIHFYPFEIIGIFVNRIFFRMFKLCFPNFTLVFSVLDVRQSRFASQNRTIGRLIIIYIINTSEY